MSLDQLNTFTSAAMKDYQDRELLDKAIVGMGAMVDLIQRHRPIPAVTDSIALANESLSLIEACASAAKAERERIVALIRSEADSFTHKPTREVILDLASAIQSGRGPRP